MGIKLRVFPKKTRKLLSTRASIDAACVQFIKQVDEDQPIITKERTNIIGSIVFKQSDKPLTDQTFESIKSNKNSKSSSKSNVVNGCNKGQSLIESRQKSVISHYQNEIDSLEMRGTLKSYLHKTLHSIVFSNEGDKIFLLEIRKQLKQSQRITSMANYTKFLKIVDELYLLALDKAFTIAPFIEDDDKQQPQILANERLSVSQNSNYRQNITQRSNISSEIMRTLQRNALLRISESFHNQLQQRALVRSQLRVSQSETQQQLVIPTRVLQFINQREQFQDALQTSERDDEEEQVMSEISSIFERRSISNPSPSLIPSQSIRIRQSFLRNNSTRIAANAGDTIMSDIDSL